MQSRPPRKWPTIGENIGQSEMCLFFGEIWGTAAERKTRRWAKMTLKGSNSARFSNVKGCSSTQKKPI